MQSFRAIRRAAARCALLLVIFIGLALAPFCSRARKSLNVAAKICVFRRAGRELRSLARLHRHRVVRAHHVLRHRRLWRRASRSIVSGPAGRAIFIGTGAALVLAVLLALMIGLFSLRVQRDFLRHDHVSGRQRLLDPCLAIMHADRRRGRPQLPACRKYCGRASGFGDRLRSRSTAASSTYYLIFVAALISVPVAAARRQFAVRPRAAGDPRQRFPRGGARLSHRGLSHAWQLPGGAARRRWPACSARCGCVTPGPRRRCLSIHARHSADGGDRRHGHDVRRGARRRALRPRRKLFAGR